MTKPMQPRPLVAPYAVVWLLAGLSFRSDLTDFLRFEVSGHYFAPFLAWWLGKRFGKRGLLPLLLASPLLLPEYYGEPTYATEIGLGLGPGMFLFCVAITSLATRPLDLLRGESLWSSVWAGALLLLVVPLRFGMGANGDGVGLEISFHAVELSCLLAFYLVFSGRFALGSALLVLVVGAALGVAAGLASSEGLRVEWEYAASGSLSWGDGALPALAVGVPAALAGAVLRRLLIGQRLDLRLWLAGLGGLVLLPVFLQSVTTVIWRLIDPEIFASISPVPGLAFLLNTPLPVDIVVVTGSRGWTPLAYQFGAGAFLLVLMALMFSAGLAGLRRMFLVPAALVALGTLSLAGVYWLEAWAGLELSLYDAEGLFRDNLTRLMAIAVVSWFAFWLGQALRPGWTGREGATSWPGM